MVLKRIATIKQRAIRIAGLADGIQIANASVASRASGSLFYPHSSHSLLMNEGAGAGGSEGSSVS